MTVAHIIAPAAATDEGRAARLLKGNTRQLERYLAARGVLLSRAGPADLCNWDNAVAGLIEANLGEVLLNVFLQLTERWPADRQIGDLVTLGIGVRAIGREAGSRVAQTVLVELPKVLAKFHEPKELRRVIDALRHLAAVAPEASQLVAGRLEHLLTQTDSEGFAAWISGGLRSGCSAAKRRSYFSLDEPLSQRLLGLGGNASDFNRLERRLSAMFVALFGRAPRFRKIVTNHTLPLARRTSLAGGVVGLPDSFPGFSGVAADAIYRAAVAHAGAHVAYSGPRFPMARLKPLQVALVSLIEDARVETLAMRTMPGLAALWRQFHTVEPSISGTAPALLMRLSRALIDSDYRDRDGWVQKGRTLFEAASCRLDDPAISREIGGLLGHDIGQMRLQFNARSHVVEPAYRDDNHFLWDYGEQPDAQTEQIDLLVDTMRLEQRQDAAGQRTDPSTKPEQQSQWSRAGMLDGQDGIPVATYPEWDYAVGVERPDWATVLERDAQAVRRDAAASGNAGTDRDVALLARNASVGRRIRLRRQADGDALDLDACIEHTTERRVGLLPEVQVYQRNIPGPRDLAVVLLLDLSQSTADRGRNGRDVLAIERESAAILASSLQQAGDVIAVHGFNSDTRERVHFIRIKGFDEPMDEVIAARLAGLASSHSTRLGAALRHAGGELARRRAFRRVLLVLTDGEPSDIDVEDPRYLAEDARRVVLQLRRRGIDAFAFGMGEGPFRRLDQIFGERRTLRVPRIEVLPTRLMSLYSELKK